MANRRETDSPQPPRSAPPPAMAKKTRKSVSADPAPLAVTPAVDAAVNTALEATAPAAAKTRKRRASAKDQAVLAATPAPDVSEDQRRGMIALSAYLRAERRGFSPEGQAEDWLAAEKEVEALLSNGHTAKQ